MDFRRVVIVEDKVSAASEGEIWLLDRAEWSEDTRGESSKLREEHEVLDRDRNIIMVAEF